MLSQKKTRTKQKDKRQNSYKHIENDEGSSGKKTIKTDELKWITYQSTQHRKNVNKRLTC